MVVRLAQLVPRVQQDRPAPQVALEVLEERVRLARPDQLGLLGQQVARVPVDPPAQRVQLDLLRQ